VLGTVLSRLVRGKWTRFTIFAGTHSATDARLALAALLGRAPLLEGPETAEYERRFARAVGARHAFSFAAGRMGLYAILKAIGVGPGDEVILPAFTCVVVPNAILYLGARPIYVDIEADTYNINPRLV
jgi:dTDP-4-amino-4,6-dideoxygalactose transaminase